ncbi:TPA: hypothetical protein ACX6RY_001022 [Photobacterium damselae]
MELIKKILFFSFLFNAIECYPIDIGTLSFNLDPNVGFVTKRVLNNTNKSQIYTISVYEVDKPIRKEVVVNRDKHELLYNPRKFVLSPGESKNVKFYYNSNNNEERYFRILFNEYGLPKDLLVNKSMYLNLSINAILVVEPKDKKFKYNLDTTNNILKNTGNAFFEVIVKESCDQDDSLAYSKKLLPGDVISNSLLNDVNHIIFIFNDRYYFMDDRCKG